jgi:hypothetical protein
MNQPNAISQNCTLFLFFYVINISIITIWAYITMLYGIIRSDTERFPAFKTNQFMSHLTSYS